MFYLGCLDLSFEKMINQLPVFSNFNKKVYELVMIIVGSNDCVGSIFQKTARLMV